MAKFNEYTVKATPEDADTLMLYDTASKTNKLSPFSGIWNWIVGKLTNAVIGNLQTNNKTVLGAINELNSKKTIEIINISKRANVSKAGELVYSGLEFAVPKGNIFIVQIKAHYQQSKPSQIAVTNSKTECTDNTVIDKAERDPAIVTCVPPINNTDSTYYVWVNYSKAGMNEVSARGISLK